MNRDYLIKEVEKLCNENNLAPADVYKKLGEIYQEDTGVNIVMEMEEKGLHDITAYLESKGLGFIERYIHCLNILKRSIIK